MRPKVLRVLVGEELSLPKTTVKEPRGSPSPDDHSPRRAVPVLLPELGHLRAVHGIATEDQHVVGTQSREAEGFPEIPAELVVPIVVESQQLVGHVPSVVFPARVPNAIKLRVRLVHDVACPVKQLVNIGRELLHGVHARRKQACVLSAP